MMRMAKTTPGNSFSSSRFEGGQPATLCRKPDNLKPEGAFSY